MLILGQKTASAESKPIESEIKPTEFKKEIDWSNTEDKVSNYFTVKECIWFPRWSRLATEEDGLTEEIKENIIKTAKKMDIVREWIGKPIRVHVWYRSLEYNMLIGGAKKSVHMEGKAVDFSVPGMTCDEFRKKMIDENKLEEWEMRCEDLFGSNWVHLDTAPVKFKRFFKP